MKKLLLLITFCLVAVQFVTAQDKLAIKTNLLYGAGAFTPNLGVEIGLGKQTTLNLSGGYNWFNLNGTLEDNKKLVHWLVQPEFRLFTRERFRGSFFGVHALYSEFNIGQHKLPMLLGKDSENYRHQGNAMGAGISYGYQLLLSNRFNLEFNIGAGYMRLKYDRYKCPRCGDKIETGKVKNYFGPTKAGISLIYKIIK